VSISEITIPEKQVWGLPFLMLLSALIVAIYADRFWSTVFAMFFWTTLSIGLSCFIRTYDSS
jgi:hypothetical protein